MKRTFIAIVVIVVVIVAIIILGRSAPQSPITGSVSGTSSNDTNTDVPAAPVAETTKVSNKTSQYQNAELGFSVNYPNSWEADTTNTGVSFIMPIDVNQVSTVAKLQADINVSSGKCSFPAVVTIKDRGTIKVGSNTFNMIAMSNNVQGRNYSNRMYSLQQGNLCYMFAFSAITLAPSSKNLTGSNMTQAENNNKAIISAADADFTTMVKSFAIVTGPAGEDETKAVPKK